MIFTAPLALLGLLALPVILLLLRLNPPPPRRIKFPPLALLQNLTAEQRTPQRMPLWVLLLRLAAAATLIVGLAGPSLHPPPALPGEGPVLLVIDNGWASAADWPQRIAAADRILAAAGRAGRSAAILATAADAGGEAPHVQGLMTARRAGQVIAALQPQPWPVDRVAATVALRGAPDSTRVYIADGITDGGGFAAFMNALRPDRVMSGGGLPALLGAPHLTGDGALTARLISGPAAGGLLAENAAGAVLARGAFDREGNAVIGLPSMLANQITSLSLDAPSSAGGKLLLDGSAHAVTVGLAATANNAETPFLGTLYFIRRALPAGAAVFTGSLAALASGSANLIVLADTPLSPPQQQIARQFIVDGGVLIRFAGPLTVASPDPLSPDPLLTGDRRLGGSLSWTTPLRLAAFPVDSPLAGLASDAAATVSRQVLADPSALDPATVWASLTDGTPLILGKAMGRGYMVDILTTANADWSSLALSGLYPQMMGRLAGLGRGTAPRPDLPLPLQASLSAFGVVSPASGAESITAARLAGITVSPAAPPGLYGAGAATLALNLGGHVPPLVRADLSGAMRLTGQAQPVDFGTPLIAVALLLLIFDLAISLWLRGLLKFFLAGFFICVAVPFGASAQTAALQTELGYILTNDAAVDQISADGLGYISADVSAHTSAQLGVPVGLDPAADDLRFYPLIYWMVLPAAAAPGPAACMALISYMAHGGLLVIDTPGGSANSAGSGAGFAPGALAAVARVTACLNLPPMTPLTAADILAHCFYIVADFPGRFTGAPVYIATKEARDADGVTPVVMGENDWAGAWARDAVGDTEEMPIPGGDDQRMLADRFGTNLVIYALTGSYKADQTFAAALLNKLGQ